MLTKAEKTKQLILETAIPLYNKKGISGVSIDNVLDEAKVTKGCLYGHFEGKDDLTVQVVDLMLKKVSDQMQLAVANAKTTKGKIAAYLDFYKDPINTYISGGCPIFNTAVEVDDNFPIIKQKVAALLRFGQEALSTILKEAIDNGEYSSQLDPVVFAFKLVASVEGGLVMCRTMDTMKPMLSLIKNLKAELEQYAL
jgi:TetR/AcrR family transcriptional regulator, transcriptional repressor for nem operon